MTKPKNYRIRVTDSLGNLSYLVRESGKVTYMSGSEMPLALSNLVDSRAAELRFELIDALNGTAALTALRKYYTSSGPSSKRKTELLA